MSDRQGEDSLEQLRRRRAAALAMGGEGRIARQHAKGRLTARERIAELSDEGVFDERGLLARSDLPEARERSPADGKITGYGKVHGRDVMISADDVTVMAGSGGRVGVAKQLQWMDHARRRGLPCVHLGDAGGARVPDIMGSAGMTSMVYPIKDHPPRDRAVPLIVAIMGECFGGAAWTAATADIVVQVKGTAMCVSGPSILAIATGEKASTEQLGGWELHERTTGLVDLFAEDDRHALALIRHVLSYLPPSAGHAPPSRASRAPASRQAGDPGALVPKDPRMTYDMHTLLEALVDADSLLELKPWYDGSLITALARIDGEVVGVLANNPKVTAGAMGPGACEKATGFIALCDSYHIPLLFVHDTPGFFVGRHAEERQMPLKIMNWIQALHQCSVPRLSLIVRKSYGMAHCNMSGGNMGNELLLAWPGADISFMAPPVAVNVVAGRRLAAMDAEAAAAAREAMIAEVARANAPWDAAEANRIDKVIEPAATRAELCAALRLARGSGGRVRSARRLANWPRMP